MRAPRALWWLLPGAPKNASISDIVPNMILNMCAKFGAGRQKCTIHLIFVA